jgi:hypothetical protein
MILELVDQGCTSVTVIQFLRGYMCLIVFIEFWKMNLTQVLRGYMCLV